MSQHQYFSAHLMLYSIGAMGIASRPLNYRKFILLIIVEMIPVPSPAPGAPSTRLAIRNLLSVPIHIIPDKPRDEYIELVNQLYAKSPEDSIYGYWITANGIYAEGDDWRYRMWVSPIEPQLMQILRHDPKYSFPMRSLSFGTEKRLTLDLDLLFRYEGHSRCDILLNRA